MLMNNKADMTIDDLREVLLENELTNFDPVAEAFKVIYMHIFMETILFIIECMKCGRKQKISARLVWLLANYLYYLYYFAVIAIVIPVFSLDLRQ